MSISRELKSLRRRERRGERDVESDKILYGAAMLLIGKASYSLGHTVRRPDRFIIYNFS